MFTHSESVNLQTPEMFKNTHLFKAIAV